MPPKFDPSQEVVIVMKTVGGEPGSPAVLAPKCGPCGISPKKVGDDIAAATKDWKGLKVTVKITIKNRQAKVEVIPSSSVLLIKELKEPVRDRKKTKNIKHDGDLSLDQVIKVAKQMRHRSQAKTLAGTVKEVLGTCVSIGCTVNGKNPKDIQQQITEGTLEINE